MIIDVWCPYWQVVSMHVDKWVGRKRGVVDLQIHWVPGHLDFEPNECADEEAKKAALGDSSDAKSLPAFL
jgi:hypothetical protein